MTKYELKILREIAGEIPVSPWGAAVGEVLGFLHRDGLITKKFGGELTEKGKAALIEGKIS